MGETMTDKAERIFDWTLKEKNNDSFKVLLQSTPKQCPGV